MTSKTLHFPIIAILMVALGVLKVQGFERLGNGELVAVVKTSATYNSSVNRNANSDSGVVVDAVAGLSFVQEATLVNLESLLYLGRSESTSDDRGSSDVYNFQLSASYPNNVERKSYYSGSLAWNRGTLANSSVGARIERDNWNFDTNYQLLLSDKSGLRFSASYSQERFADSLLVGNDDYSFTGGALFRYSEKTDLSFNYRYRELLSSQRVVGETEGHAIFFQIDGSILPKIDGSFAIGAQDYSSLESASGITTDSIRPYYSAELSWSATDKLTVVLEGLKDFGLAATGELVDKTTLILSFTNELNVFKSLAANVSIADERYDVTFVNEQEREDTRFELDLIYSQALNLSSSLSARIGYDVSQSSIVFFDYDGFRISLSYDFTY
ncbi:hypothetical protein MLD52_10080 [Puniceicoccaceae bacterium K14]|nr:hypothetical protein [Puniceicoccaceae bacterium K14]